jgi:hypothetical protein
MGEADLVSVHLIAGVAAEMEDRPFDAAPFADLADARAERKDLWFRLSLDSEALATEINDIRDAPPADPSTVEWLNASQNELRDPAITNDRRASPGSGSCHADRRVSVR